MSASLSTCMSQWTTRGQPRSPSSSSSLWTRGLFVHHCIYGMDGSRSSGDFSCQSPILQAGVFWRIGICCLLCLCLGFAFSSPRLRSTHLPTERSPWSLCFCLGFAFRSSHLRSLHLPLEQSPWSLTFLGIQFWDLLEM